MTTDSRRAAETPEALRLRAVSYSLGAAVGLTAVKLFAGWWTGSLGVMSEGIHSLLDLVSAALAFLAVRAAGKPADEGHPYGHGKFETLSSLFESGLLVVAALWIMWEAIAHLHDQSPIEHSGAAIAVIALSTVVSWIVYRHNRHAANQLESPAIEANALHFLADSVTSIGVLAALLLMEWTGWRIIDPLVAFGIAAYILLISYRQISRSLGDLSDTQLPEGELTTIRSIMREFHGAHGTVIEAHGLRSRRSGPQRHIDFHLVVCGKATVRESHEVCDAIEDKLTDVYPGVSVNIHVEPCEHENTTCLDDCPYRSDKRKAPS